MDPDRDARGPRIRGDGSRKRSDGLRQFESAAEPFDVVLLDFRLPDSADLRLLERIRSLAPDAQVIMMTAHKARNSYRERRRFGAYRVVSKPFEIESMAALVKQARRG